MKMSSGMKHGKMTWTYMMIWMIGAAQEIVRARRGYEPESKISLNQIEKLQRTSISGYKGGRMLILESSLCLRLGSSSGGGE